MRLNRALKGVSLSRYVGHVLLLCVVAGLVSCRDKPAPPATQPVEERVNNLEEYINGGNPPPNQEVMRKEAEQDLAEIRAMGLVDRAARDFTNRIPGAVTESFHISYFMTTNFVWCEVSYKLSGNSERQGQEFGYQRANGTNWNLIWKDEKEQ